MVRQRPTRQDIKNLRRRLYGRTVKLGPDVCWVYMGASNKIWVDWRTPMTIHQAAWLVNHGKITEGDRIAACPIMPKCVHPLHIGSGKEIAEIRAAAKSKVRARRVDSLTDDEVMEIFNSPLSTSELAAKFHRSAALVSNIKHGRRYTSVTGASDAMDRE